MCSNNEDTKGEPRRHQERGGQLRVEEDLGRVQIASVTSNHRNSAGDHLPGVYVMVGDALLVQENQQTNDAREVEARQTTTSTSQVGVAEGDGGVPLRRARVPQGVRMQLALHAR